MHKQYANNDDNTSLLSELKNPAKRWLPTASSRQQAIHSGSESIPDPDHTADKKRKPLVDRPLALLDFLRSEHSAKRRNMVKAAAA